MTEGKGAPQPVRLATPPPLGAEAIKAFAHPLRTAMYQYLGAHGPATASQLARQFGESTGQTSYHLRQLERHGLIEDDPDRPAGGRERWWRPISFSLDPRTLDDPAAKAAAHATMRAVVADRARALQEWFDTGVETQADWVDAALHMQSTPMLTRDELDNLATAITEAAESVLGPAKLRADAERRAAASGAAGGGGEAGGSGRTGEGRQPALPDRRRVRLYLDAFPLVTDD